MRSILKTVKQLILLAIVGVVYLFYKLSNTCGQDSMAASKFKDPSKSINSAQIFDTLDNQELHPKHPSPQIPKNTKVLPVVHYLHCKLVYPRQFTFIQYMTIESIMKVVQPDRLYFYYPTGFYPQEDTYKYNTWLNETLGRYPWIIVENVTLDCKQEESLKLWILKMLQQRGGVYIGTQTIFLEWDEQLWNEDFQYELRNFQDGYALCSQHCQNKGNIRYLASTYTQKNKKNCTDFRQYQTSYKNDSNAKIAANSTDQCIVFTEDDQLYPKDMWDKTDKLSRKLNELMYNTETTPRAIPSYEVRIPNIAHVLSLGGREMNFLFYLCVLSLKYIVKVDKVYIYGELPPKGVYWQELLQKHAGIEYIVILRPNNVFNQKVIHNHHQSDIFRAQTLLKYGGLYSDYDAIWTREIPQDLWYYDAVGSMDWAKTYIPYPEYFNLGVVMAKPGAEYWKRVSESMKDFRDFTFGYNGLLQPYKVFERNPALMYIDNRLQVMCFKNKCYPQWENHKNWTQLDWKTETCAFHWTYPDPDEYQDRETLLKSNTLFAQIGKYVLEAAGEL